MKCDRCYYKNPDDVDYCINCGKKLPEKAPEKPIVYSAKEVLKKEEHKKKENKRSDNDYYITEYRGP